MPNPRGVGRDGPTQETLGQILRRRGCRWGGFVLSVNRTDSTNRMAASLARSGAPHGGVIIASEQSSGRGRWSRDWESPLGGLYLSAVVRSDESPEPRLPTLPLRVAVAAAEAVERATGARLELRWPNDLYFGPRKLGGILCESSFAGSRLEFVVIGIGINVSQRQRDFSPAVSSRATSLRELSGRDVDRAVLIVELVCRLESWWEASPEASVLSEWRRRARGFEGARVRVETREGDRFEATTRGLGRLGELRVELDDGSFRELRSDDVHLLDD